MTKALLKQIAGMDKKSEEFFEIYKSVTDKYFDFDEPDEYQKHAQLLKMILDRGEPWQIVMMVKLYAELLKFENSNGPCHGTFHVKNKEIFFDFYMDKKSLGKIHTMMREAVLATAKGNGEQ